MNSLRLIEFGNMPMLTGLEYNRAGTRKVIWILLEPTVLLSFLHKNSAFSPLLCKGFFFFFLNKATYTSGLFGDTLFGYFGLFAYACTHFDFSLSCIGEGNGNPLQYSCLENPRDGGAWWAAIYGVVQSRTWLKRLSSSSAYSINSKILKS